MDNKGLNIIKRLIEEVKIIMDDTGGCDHSVGLCICHLSQLIYDAEEFFIYNKE